MTRKPDILLPKATPTSTEAATKSPVTVDKNPLSFSWVWVVFFLWVGFCVLIFKNDGKPPFECNAVKRPDVIGGGFVVGCSFDNWNFEERREMRQQLRNSLRD